MQKVLILLIRGYRYVLSPLLGQNCRFHPVCSSYALEAIRLHGSLRGGWYALCRILKCHQLHPGGHDPVPGTEPCGRHLHDETGPDAGNNPVNT